jgi:hypothetical protein
MYVYIQCDSKLLSGFPWPLDFFLCVYVKDIVYKIPVTSLDEVKLRIVAAMETTTLQMLENTWREI